jgi:hypothetical protein
LIVRHASVGQPDRDRRQHLTTICRKHVRDQPVGRGHVRGLARQPTLDLPELNVFEPPNRAGFDDDDEFRSAFESVSEGIFEIVDDIRSEHPHPDL